MYHNRQFIQILEGDKEIIENLYSKIKQDKKHSNVNLLDTNETSTRIFSQWVLAFKEINFAENSHCAPLVNLRYDRLQMLLSPTIE